VFDTSALIQLRNVDPSDNASKAFYATGNSYFYDTNGVKNLVVLETPNNANQCAEWFDGPGGQQETGFDPLEVPYSEDPTQRLFVDGAAQIGGTGAGVVEGTPTAVLTDTDIDQITDGASIQFNWNFEKHKFMVGVSIDAPSAKYTSGQMLGLLDANRNAYLAPDQIRDQYAAADQSISNNNFEGSQLTKSIYFSETWSPIETLHITGAARYNDTHGKNKIASRTFGFTVFDLAQFEAFPNEYDLCINGVCPTTGYIVPDVSKLLNAPETEKFSYYSLNPSFGVSWQADPNLNMYSNWAQGTRTPSVIELGCAFDDTPVPIGGGQYIARSLKENRSCSLPSTLSGDPYLPQIRAQTIDLGMRGRWGDNMEWNLGAYQTDLKDDIYLITFPGNRSFFDSIGDTRRRGIEAGISAAFGKVKVRLNYALTEATFEDTFYMAANDNSSSEETLFGNDDYGRQIKVKPGDRMPGVPLHNLNATFSYDLTPKWQVGFTAVAHSMAYVRGNENNEHEVGVTLYDSYKDPTLGGDTIKVARKATSNPGKVPGYTVFNFQTSYKLASEWTLGLRVNNIFDKEFFTAGRLGRNPFSPSIYGAIGPDGYNHNSSDWLSTNFLAPGAPRAAWISLSYEFDPDR
jgi:outer membrane receptor protein involved in Fe transport